jgi:hypothetical protein
MDIINPINRINRSNRSIRNNRSNRSIRVNRNDSHILLWFQGTDRADATLDIWQDSNNVYNTSLCDKHLNPAGNNLFKFTEYSDLCEYIELVFDNMLLDTDEFTPFEQVQWDIPGFTSSIINIHDIDEHHVYRTFCRCINFYFSMNT